MTRVFYKELNINQGLCDVKINQSIISERQLKISIFSLAKAPGITKDLVMGYSFFLINMDIFPFSILTMLLIISLRKTALGEAVLISFSR